MVAPFRCHEIFTIHSVVLQISLYAYHIAFFAISGSRISMSFPLLPLCSPNSGDKRRLKKKRKKNYSSVGRSDELVIFFRKFMQIAGERGTDCRRVIGTADLPSDAPNLCAPKARRCVYGEKIYRHIPRGWKWSRNVCRATSKTICSHSRASSSLTPPYAIVPTAELPRTMDDTCCRNDLILLHLCTPKIRVDAGILFSPSRLISFVGDLYAYDESNSFSFKNEMMF